MKEEWEVLDDFPQYAVSNFGNVVNIRTGEEKKPSFNNLGVTRVTLFLGSKAHTRSLGRLVANAFIPKEKEIFDTVIHLDNDSTNCQVTNLAWRPRWFAVKYRQQFKRPDFYTHHGLIELLQTGEQFDFFKEPAIQYGELAVDVYFSCRYSRLVFPTSHEYRLLNQPT